ncbi:MAG: hypothetical protein PHV79_00145 [Clostridia bacterium]|jgi:hypothetical protein|nr:hypothetical protein [Clostridia bacterium]
MLKEINLKESYLVSDGKLYAYCPEINRKREMNGCEGRQELATEIGALNNKKAQLEKELASINKELANLIATDSKLAGCGYCKKDAPIYKKIEGVVVRDVNGNAVISGFTHSDICSHKEG